MKTIATTVTTNGRITIPAEMRRYLGVKKGDKLSFVIDDAGKVALEALPYPTVASLRERSTKSAIDLTYDEMKEIAYEDRTAARRINGK
jgi:AbrB family looped-hinge helix DNA binding protein